MPVKNQYSELLKMSSPCEKLIRRDIARTYPEHEFFKGQDSLGQEVLFNVMKVRPLEALQSPVDTFGSIVVYFSWLQTAPWFGRCSDQRKSVIEVGENGATWWPVGDQ